MSHSLVAQSGYGLSFIVGLLEEFRPGLGAFRGAVDGAVDGVLFAVISINPLFARGAVGAEVPVVGD